MVAVTPHATLPERQLQSCSMTSICLGGPQQGRVVPVMFEQSADPRGRRVALTSVMCALRLITSLVLLEVALLPLGSTQWE